MRREFSGRDAPARRALVLATELATSMRQAVGFRKVLVHEYVAVDDEIVVDRLKDLGDLRAFVATVADYVTAAR